MKHSSASSVSRRGIALLVALVFVLAAAFVHAQSDGQDGEEAVADSEPLVRAFYSGATFFTAVVSDDAARVFPGPADNAYQNLPGGGLDGGAAAVIAGNGTLVTLRFTAESQCAGGGTDPGWCGVRILVDGVEALPAPADYAFDSTNSGEDGAASWEGHAMDRHICIANPGGAVRFVPVQVQWRVFSSDGDTTPPSFRLDDWTLTIESAVAGCP